MAEEGRKEEMNSRQRSRQLWLKEGEANTCFFHLVANGRTRINYILSIKVGTHQHNGMNAIGRAMTDHFRAMTQRGVLNRWRWTGSGASQLTEAQKVDLVRPFVLEVQAAIAGLNGEGALGPDGLPVYFYKEF